MIERERLDISRKAELNPEKIEDHLRDRLEVLCRRAKHIGVTTNCIVQHGNLMHGLNDDKELFGASLGKIPLAYMVIDRLDPNEMLDIDDSVRLSGGGMYDHKGESVCVPVGRVLEDMLRYSGNTAYRVLSEAVDGPDEINLYYDDQGWGTTNVIKAANGRTQLGYTTPRESLLQLQALLDPTDQRQLAEVARVSLSHNAVENHGIRQIILPGETIKISNKTGEYNGDSHDPAIFRHDVGLVSGPKGTVWYSVMTAAPLISRGYFSDMVVGQFGAEIVHAVGGHDKFVLGSLALRASK